jgi:hypothetical protein
VGFMLLGLLSRRGFHRKHQQLLKSYCETPTLNTIQLAFTRVLFFISFINCDKIYKSLLVKISYFKYAAYAASGFHG